MKRMIDNKDYDTLKNKVDNIKDIPTITIDVSQMTDESHAQLTDEQYEIIENNSFINVVFPNGTSCGFNRFIDGYEGYHLAMCSGNTSEITYFTASIDSTTKIATIVIGDFNGSGKLYQHNISIKWQPNNAMNLFVKIINDNNTPFTISSLIQWLYDNNFKDDNHGYQVSGYSTYSGYNGVYISICNDTSLRILISLLKPDGTHTNDSLSTNSPINVFNDVIVKL